MFLSCDPGLTGAIAVFTDECKFITYIRVPTIERLGAPTVKREISGKVLHGQIMMIIGEVAGSIVYLEEPPVFRCNSRVVIASLQRSTGIIKGVFESLGCRVVYVDPREWKKAFNLIKKPKRESIAVAQKLIPEIGKILVKDADIAEAALIGIYGNKYIKPMTEGGHYDLF